jgi:hypothetical protein
MAGRTRNPIPSEEEQLQRLRDELDFAGTLLATRTRTNAA